MHPIILAALLALPRGEIVDRVEASDGHTYALFLPSSFTPDRTWPVIFCFDPQARGRLPLERFQPAAQKYGFILVGSNNSRNNRFDVSVQAMNALWNDVHSKFPVDEKRRYSAGFSGGSRVATWMALHAPGLAGVFITGGGFPEPIERAPFAVFATAGTDDFNWWEVKHIDARLDELRTPHRVVIFEGSHTWPPPEVAARAVEWFELHAMKTGRRPRDEAFIDRLLQERAARIASLPPAEQWIETVAIAEEFAGLRDVSEHERRAAELRKSDAVKRHLKTEKQELERGQALDRELQDAMVMPDEVADRPVATGRANDLIRRARARADAPQDTSDRRVARRTVGGLFVLLMDRGREDFERKKVADAVRVLGFATELQPGLQTGWLQLSRALALSGNEKKSLEALRKAMDRGFRDTARLAQDPAFEKVLKLLEGGL